MGIKATEVKMADVIANPKNPRVKFDGIKELAESFAANTDRPGEPFLMPLLAKDANKLVIIDGERRVKAMKTLKKQSFWANVADSMDDANMLMAMIATDNKQQLSASEMSVGVQQALDVGVPYETVDKGACLQKGTAAKVGKAVAAVKEAAVTMSIDRLNAIAELEDDAEAVRELTECSESDWEHAFNRIVRRRRNARHYDEVLAASKELGLTVLEERPPKAKVLDSMYFHGEDSVLERMRRGLGSERIGKFVVASAPDQSVMNYSVDICEMASVKTPEEAASLESDNSLKKGMTADKRRRAEFVSAAFDKAGVKALKNTGRFFEQLAKDKSWMISKFLNKASRDDAVPVHASEWMIAYLWEEADGMTQAQLIDISRGDSSRTFQGPYGLAEAAKLFDKLLCALEADGYKPSESETALKNSCRKAIAAAKAKEGAANEAV